jgi:hypothetical protein
MNPTNPDQEPRRTAPPEQPGQTPPNEAPPSPATEYEKHVPHDPNQPVARAGTVGEGSYEGTRAYDDGLEQFSKDVSPEEAVQRARKIDVDDPELKDAERRGKAHEHGRSSHA